MLCPFIKAAISVGVAQIWQFWSVGKVKIGMWLSWRGGHWAEPPRIQQQITTWVSREHVVEFALSASLPRLCVFNISSCDELIIPVSRGSSRLHKSNPNGDFHGHHKSHTNFHCFCTSSGCTIWICQLQFHFSNRATTKNCRNIRKENLMSVRHETVLL